MKLKLRPVITFDKRSPAISMYLFMSLLILNITFKD